MTARIFLLALLSVLTSFAAEDHLPNTQLLTTPGDLASNLVAGVDRFLLKQLEESESKRAAHWHRDFSSLEAYDKSVQTNRDRFARIIGARDRNLTFAPKRIVFDRRIIQTTNQLQIETFRYPAFGDVTVEGIVLWPLETNPGNPKPCVIAIPDADVMPEQLAGLYEGVPDKCQYARILAASGCVVVIPSIVNRKIEKRGNADLSNREYLYRSAFELGRNLAGYETLKVLALVEAATKSPWCNGRIGVIGWGEGGFIALCAAVLEKNIDATVVSGYFDDRRHVWEQPIDRNIFGLLDEFGDAELATLVAPRTLIIEACQGPEVLIKGNGGAPGKLETPKLASVQREFQRARELLADLKAASSIELVVNADGVGPYGSRAAIQKLLDKIATGKNYKSNSRFEVQGVDITNGRDRDTNQIHEIDRHNQWLLSESPYVRAEFMKKLDVSSPEKYAQTSAEYRDFFYKEVIGKFDLPLLPANPHSRLAYDKELWTGYEVTLDVFPDVIAYGILLVPKNIKEGERRPVVVCQHGLEGRAQDVVTGDSQYYHDFAAKLAERGFITFAPQNLYIFKDRFRTLQRKANPLGKTLFSIITPQHQQIVNWLKTLPYVDGNRIGFYGLSYGGKTAMRVPALVTDYALSICSADFNEWVGKNASTRSPYSYVWGGEYEIYEFDLGSTFNYAEMAALIAPRPFMVERGHFDNVAPDETVAYEFAKVQNLFEARLKLPPDKCQIEWFVGPHTINGKGTFDFLHKHLNWPKP